MTQMNLPMKQQRTPGHRGQDWKLPQGRGLGEGLSEVAQQESLNGVWPTVGAQKVFKMVRSLGDS